MAVPLRQLAARAGLLLSNWVRVAKLQRKKLLQVHLGCGDDRVPGFVNVDRRPTSAADAVMDLDLPRFAPGSIAIAFSNAFFEHLYRDSRLPHLRRILECLAADGLCCYIGIPYFPNVARFYLERAPGTAGPLFDLYNVYRYTHGDPEQAPSWWLSQVHKSLFDEQELAVLVQESGFASFVMFCYGYPGDATELPVNMGFYASKAVRPAGTLRGECLTFLGRFADRKIRLGTLEWL